MDFYDAHNHLISCTRTHDNNTDNNESLNVIHASSKLYGLLSMLHADLAYIHTSLLFYECICK